MVTSSTILPVYRRDSAFRMPFAANEGAALSISTPLPDNRHSSSTVSFRQDIYLGSQANTAVRGNGRTPSLWNWHPYIDRTIAVLGLAIGIAQFIRGLVDHKMAAAVSRYHVIAPATNANACTIRIRLGLGRHRLLWRIELAWTTQIVSIVLELYLQFKERRIQSIIYRGWGK